MKKYVLKNAHIVNEGKSYHADLYIANGIIQKIAPNIDLPHFAIEIKAEGKYLIPGIIDDQVHFREPGLTHKAEIYTEAKAAVAGGVTSFMEMPNTKPAATTLHLLEEKYEIAKKKSLANYSFFMGTTDQNVDEVLKINPKMVCGVKIFLGSSTGDMLVQNTHTLEKIFANSPTLIAIHSEDDDIVAQNLKKYQNSMQALTVAHHPLIRDEIACFEKTKYAVALAEKHGTKLHVLHISTADELQFFTNQIPLAQKKITSEVCVHHLWFSAHDYQNLGNLIKCNPAIKDEKHKIALLNALLNNTLDIVATDHAPHTYDEKQQTYLQAPSGIPLVQHSLQIMLKYMQQGKISITQIVEKMCHNPAILFQISNRGFLREGYCADMVLIDPHQKMTVNKENILYKCKWSPFEGHTFQGCVTHTFVNGHLAYHDQVFDESFTGQRLTFER